jgi:hypothetical protein
VVKKVDKLNLPHLMGMEEHEPGVSKKNQKIKNSNAGPGEHSGRANNQLSVQLV